MPRGSLRHYSSRGRRSGVQRDTAVMCLVLAILVNFAGLYLTHRMMLATFEPFEPTPKREEVFGLDLFSDDEFGADLEPASRGEGERPDPNDDDPSSSPKDEQPGDARPRDRAKPKPEEEPTGRPDAAGAGDDQGVGRDQGAVDDTQVGPGDDDLVSAPDGELAGSGDARGGTHGRPDPLANLGGSTSMLDKTFGPAPSADRMRDVDEGVDSVLESKRHLYGSFFNRMRDRVVEHWDPNRAHNRADPDGSRFGNSNRTTVLMVRLDASGKLLKTVIVQKSGAPHLDEEAIRAMQAASPFPNPPSGLPDAKGHIEFLVGFTLDFSGVARMFRMQR